MTPVTRPDPAATPFGDLDTFVRLPRQSGLTLSPDGSALAVGVSSPDPDCTAYRTAIWWVDPRGERPARRLTRGARGESTARWTRGNDLLFCSRRPDPQAGEADDDASPLWLLPAGGGEARVLATLGGGVADLRVARAADTVLIRSPLFPGAADVAADERIRSARRKAKVTAILHAQYPVRYWDSDLGPDQPHLLVADLPASDPADPAVGGGEGRLAPRSVTPDPRAGLVEADIDLSADGSLVVSTWTVPAGRGDARSELVSIEPAGGGRRTLLADRGADLGAPHLSPDAATVAYLRESHSTPDLAGRITLHLLDVADGSTRQLVADWDRWPSGLAWLPAGDALLVTADQAGRGPIFRIEVAGSGSVRQLTDDDYSYTDLAVAPDGSAVYALRSGYRAPAHPVRVDLTGATAGRVTPLLAPVPLPDLPGELQEVTATAADGTPVRAWLALPAGADADTPAPLLLWIHGGPLGSWNSWSWRWTPWCMVAAGYAVLLPDPALSTGYGQDFVQRGWGRWGDAPYTDLMAITDAALDRPDLDSTRTAAMGGSFGGYMANWVAGHTDRFAAIVTHASLWALGDFGGVTDVAYYWNREMTPEMERNNSPHRFVADIVTPMLVIHGDKDYRVPITQGGRLFYDLLSRSGLPMDDQGRSPHRYLYFPDENHWVLSPQHAAVWYRVVLDFLAEHVLGEAPAPLPPLLGGPPDAAGAGDSEVPGDGSAEVPFGHA